jgi:HEAT repeat protein
MPAAATSPVDLDTCVRQLQTGDEQTRAAVLVSLGKLRAERAVGPMVKALNSDASPKVREAAARGLGLIASPSALSALQYAAQADDDADVRHSASFAAEVIRGNLRR